MADNVNICICIFLPARRNVLEVRMVRFALSAIWRWFFKFVTNFREIVSANTSVKATHVAGAKLTSIITIRISPE